MKLVLLAAALLLAPSLPAADAPASAPPASGSEQLALLADFVELGRVDRSVPRDMAMVDLVNVSPHVLDIVIGESGATLQPKERIIARVKAGPQAVTVTTREKGIAPMEGRLQLDAGLRYELALAFGPVPKMSADLAPALDSQDGGAAIAPKPEGSGAAATSAEPRKEPRRTRGGKVDVGRRRR